jgi:hypothetical protein
LSPDDDGLARAASPRIRRTTSSYHSKCALSNEFSAWIEKPLEAAREQALGVGISTIS